MVFLKERGKNEHFQNKNIAAILNKFVVFSPFTSNVFLRNNEAYKLY